MNEHERNRLLSPILIGVAGHTRIRSDYVPVLSARIQEILEDFQKKYQHTPLILVSSLAEGADQICADVAIKLGMEVIAPLPFPVDLYEKRFKDDGAKNKLREFTQNLNVRSFCPIGPDGAAIDFGQIIVNDKYRAQRYADVAAFIARHSHAMLILWDQGRAEKSSITTQIVDYKTLGRLPPNIHPVTGASELGIVYHIFTPRPEWTSAQDGTPGEVKMLPESPIVTESAKTDWKEPFRPIALFERTCALTNSLNQLLNRELASSKPLPVNKLLKDTSTCSKAQNDLAVFRKLVSNLSGDFKSRVVLDYGVVFFLVFLGAALLHAYGHIFDEGASGLQFHPSLLIASLACFLAAALYPRLRNTRRSENRSLDYRALAEALRVQFHWHYAGLCAWAPDHYLQRQRSELDWIRQATRAWALRLQVEDSLSSSNRSRLEQVVNDWFDEQVDFYKKNHSENKKSLDLWRGISRLCAIFGFTLAALLPCLFLAAQPPHHPFPYLLVVGIALLASAMTLAYAEKRLFVEHARHFGAMRDVFHGAKIQSRYLLDAMRDADVSDVLIQMGKEALDENTDWLILHRVRHFEVPPAG